MKINHSLNSEDEILYKTLRNPKLYNMNLKLLQAKKSRLLWQAVPLSAVQPVNNKQPRGTEDSSHVPTHRVLNDDPYQLVHSNRQKELLFVTGRSKERLRTDSTKSSPPTRKVFKDTLIRASASSTVKTSGTTHISGPVSNWKSKCCDSNPCLGNIPRSWIAHIRISSF